jgi:hypothetical protein
LPHGRKKALAALAAACGKLKRNADFRVGAGFALGEAGGTAMIAAVGLAMGALSTVSSLVEQAASSINAAANPPPVQTFATSPAPAAPAAKASVPSAALNPGVPIPKFDKRTHAHLLALQEKLHA